MVTVVNTFAWKAFLGITVILLEITTEFELLNEKAPSPILTVSYYNRT